jgi:hypothetical protein
MKTISEFLDILPYGRSQGRTAEVLYNMVQPGYSTDKFNRLLRELASEARKLGHRVIGDDKGYYIALNEKEWKDYCERRYCAIRNELISLAGAERISVVDLLKMVYSVDVNNKNFNLF